MNLMRWVRGLHVFWRALILVAEVAFLAGIVWSAGLPLKEFWTICAILVIAGISSVYLSNRGAGVWAALDWRTRAVVLSLVGAIVITLILLAAGIWRDVHTFWGAVFAGWVSAVVFFTVVGALVAGVSVAQPERESFDSRARILFRRQSGPHIDYIVTRLKSTFEQYAEETHDVFVIARYHPGEKKYRIRTDGTTTIRSYIDDVPSTYSSMIELTEVTPPPEREEGNRLSYLRIGDRAEPGADFAHAISREFTTEIAPFGSCVIKHGFELWHLAGGEAHELTPTRYTQKLHVEIDNRTGNEVKIMLTLRGSTEKECRIPANERQSLFTLAELEPGVRVYTFKILPP